MKDIVISRNEFHSAEIQMQEVQFPAWCQLVKDEFYFFFQDKIFLSVKKLLT